MIRLPDKLSAAYNRFMAQCAIPPGQHIYYRKWLCYYVDFCKKYNHPYADPQSLSEFLIKLEDKGQSETLCEQAQSAVSLYYEMLLEHGKAVELTASNNGQQEHKILSSVVKGEAQTTGADWRWFQHFCKTS